MAAGSTLDVYLFGLNEQGVGIVEGVPRGLPGFSLPPLELEPARALLTVALVGFVESISVAKAIAAREKYKIDPDGELRALGLSNVSAAFFSGFPVTASFSSPAVSYQSGVGRSSPRSSPPY